MRILADMGISPSTVQMLRDLGHDAVHLRDQGLHRMPDAEVLRKARDENRVLLTSDLDFGYLMAIAGAVVPSIVLFRLSDMRPASVSTRTEKLLGRYADELSRGALVVVTDTRIRVRALPIGRERE
jgi:predicted nuclease of predicted toxin-antitoxin system